jgi:cell wall-associated NlpC family hydrolase
MFVQSPFAVGWVKSSDVALVDKKFIKEYKSLSKSVAIKDNIAVSDSDDNFIYYAKLATIFATKDNKIQVIKKDNKNYAYLQEAKILEPKSVASYPIKFDSTNTKNIANELIGEFYGWGELLDTRDCSALTRDFLRVFGIWLPRNSAGQKSKGEYTKISHLSAKEKEQKIIAKAVPFLSTIYLRGHIMLYIGHHKGKVLVFHNTWGIKTLVFTGYGRKVVGKAVVTTLRAGEELPDVATDKMLIHRLKGFTNH